MIFGKKTGGGELTEAAVMGALATVNDPELHKDLVTLGMVKDVKIEGGEVRVVVELTTPACPLKDKIEGDVRAALEKVAGVEKVTVGFTANVSKRPMAGEGEELAPGVRNIVAVGSGKGGVGKSTTALNLALALEQTGARVGLLDADIYGPNIPMMMGVTAQPEVQDKKMVPIEKFGIKMISMGLLVPEDTPVIWRGPMLNSALRQFFGDVVWGELDYLVVDLPPGTGDVQISLVQLVKVTGAVIVTTPQGVSLQDARKAMAMFKQTQTEVLGIIENMSYFIAPDTGKRYDIFDTGGGERAAEELGIPFLGAIPLGMRVREGGDTGDPIVIADPEGEIAMKYKEIAKGLAARISIANLG